MLWDNGKQPGEPGSGRRKKSGSQLLPHRQGCLRGPAQTRQPCVPTQFNTHSGAPPQGPAGFCRWWASHPARPASHHLPGAPEAPAEREDALKP